MSTIRKSFIIHKDSLGVLDELSNEQAGLLFKAIKAYQNDEQIDLDALTKIAMSPFKSQFERDSSKYEKLCEKNRLIAESRYKGNSTKSTTGTSGNQPLPTSTKSTDNDSDSDSKSDSKSKENKECKAVTEVITVPENKFSNEDIEFSKWFYSKLIEINPKHKKPNFDKWADVVRLMRIIDKKSYQEMSDLIMWINSNDFWKGNILSPAKLRKNWDMLIIQQARDFEKSKPRQFSKAAERTINNIIDVELD